MQTWKTSLFSKLISAFQLRVTLKHMVYLLLLAFCKKITTWQLVSVDFHHLYFHFINFNMNFNLSKIYSFKVINTKRLSYSIQNTWRRAKTVQKKKSEVQRYLSLICFLSKPVYWKRKKKRKRPGLIHIRHSNTSKILRCQNLIPALTTWDRITRRNGYIYI